MTRFNLKSLPPLNTFHFPFEIGGVFLFSFVSAFSAVYDVRFISSEYLVQVMCTEKIGHYQ